VYDKRHLLLEKKIQGNRIVSYTYKPAGEIETEIFWDDEGGWKQEYIYDDSGRVKEIVQSEVDKAAKISFTLYMKKDTVFPSSTKKDEASKLPGTQHYLAFDPGWIKTGIGESNTFIKDLPIVTLDDGNEYYKEKIEVAFFGSTSYTELTICPTMGYVQYSGSMFIDDISFFKKD
jgi:hypothetical protein